MKIAVMSCIHGNYEALNAVLSDIDDHKAEQIFCLGDLVGYGPHPNAVVEMIRSLDIPTCQGCWDEDIVEGLNACDCSYPSLLAESRGKAAHAWTDHQIHPETREYLAQLPLVIKEKNMSFVHGSPNGQHEYLLPDVNAFTALERVLSTGSDILFCGRSGLQFNYQIADGSSTSTVMTLDGTTPATTMETSNKFVVGVGNVGLTPNLASYTIYSPNSGQVQFKQVSYGFKGFGNKNYHEQSN